jgi:hypothetical protein
MLLARQWQSLLAGPPARVLWTECEPTPRQAVRGGQTHCRHPRENHDRPRPAAVSNLWVMTGGRLIHPYHYEHGRWGCPGWPDTLV